MAIICKPAVVLPEHVVTQEEFLNTLRQHYHGIDGLDAKLRLAAHTSIEKRHFVIPLKDILKHPGVKARTEYYLQAGTSLAVSAIKQALANAQLTARDIQHFILVSCTIPTVILPGMDAHLVNALDMPYNVRRLPIAQMGCHGGATSLAQAYQYLRAYPQDNVLICSLELCSLNEQPEDTDASSFISKALFGDGCAAVVMRGDELASGPRMLATNQHLVPGTLTDICYLNDDLGNHFATNREVLRGVKQGFPIISAFLADQGYDTSDLDFLVLHTGGPRVMNMAVAELGVAEQFVAASRESLREVGNLSSATVIDVLKRTFERYRPEDGAIGLLLGYGPGTTIEMALIEWQEN